MSTSKKEILRQQRQLETLQSLGFTEAEAEQLRRISKTLHRWHELECGVGDRDTFYVERENADDTGRPFMVSANTGRRWPIPDRETGARKRLAKIIKARNERKGHADGDINWRCDNGTFDTADEHGVKKQNLPTQDAILATYIQTDPRGAALYIIRPGDVPEGADVGAYYSRGICVY